MRGERKVDRVEGGSRENQEGMAGGSHTWKEPWVSRENMKEQGLSKHEVLGPWGRKKTQPKSAHFCPCRIIARERKQVSSKQLFK